MMIFVYLEMLKPDKIAGGLASPSCGDLVTVGAWCGFLAVETIQNQQFR